MSLDGLLSERPELARQASPILEAVIADSATALGNDVEVIFPTFGDNFRAGPCPWMPRAVVDGLRMPAKGDRALVVIDEDGRPWIAAWQGVGVLVPDSAGGGGGGDTTALQAELDAHEALGDTAHGGLASQTELNAHGALTTSAHGGLVSSGDVRLSDQRVPVDGSVTNAKVAAAAGIPKSKLAPLEIVDGDVSAAAAIADAKLAAAARIPTAEQKAAMAGSAGAPGGSNRFATESDPNILAGRRLQHSFRNTDLSVVVTSPTITDLYAVGTSGAALQVTFTAVTTVAELIGEVPYAYPTATGTSNMHLYITDMSDAALSNPGGGRLTLPQAMGARLTARGFAEGLVIGNSYTFKLRKEVFAGAWTLYGSIVPITLTAYAR